MEGIKAEGPDSEETTLDTAKHLETAGHKEAEHRAASEHSPWPFLLAVGMLIVSVGLLYQIAIVAVGAALCLAAVIGWLWQPWVS